MRIAGPVDSNVRTGLKALAAMPRRCEKSSDSNALGQDNADVESDRRKGQPTLRVQLVSQNNTSPLDPFWDGPRLMPAFVAQLIGQTLPERRDAAAKVETAYGTLGAARMALLVDRKS